MNNVWGKLNMFVFAFCVSLSGLSCGDSSSGNAVDVVEDTGIVPCPEGKLSEQQGRSMLGRWCAGWNSGKSSVVFCGIRGDGDTTSWNCICEYAGNEPLPESPPSLYKWWCQANMATWGETHNFDDPESDAR